MPTSPQTETDLIARALRTYSAELAAEQDRAREIERRLRAELEADVRGWLAEVLRLPTAPYVTVVHRRSGNTARTQIAVVNLDTGVWLEFHRHPQGLTCQIVAPGKLTSSWPVTSLGQLGHALATAGYDPDCWATFDAPAAS